MSDPIDELYAYDGAMFGFGVDVYKMLNILENNLLMLSDSDQEFVQSMLVLTGTGIALDAKQIGKLKQLVSTLTASSHNTLGEALSMVKVVKDLSGAVHTLNQGEKQFLSMIIQRMQQKIPLEQQQVAHLLSIYTNKGF